MSAHNRSVICGKIIKGGIKYNIKGAGNEKVRSGAGGIAGGAVSGIGMANYWTGCQMAISALWDVEYKTSDISESCGAVVDIVTGVATDDYKTAVMGVLEAIDEYLKKPK